MMIMFLKDSLQLIVTCAGGGLLAPHLLWITSSSKQDKSALDAQSQPASMQAGKSMLGVACGPAALLECHGAGKAAILPTYSTKVSNQFPPLPCACSTQATNKKY